MPGAMVSCRALTDTPYSAVLGLLEQVLVAARGDLVGGGAQLEVGHARQLRDRRGGVGNAGRVAAEHADHVGRDQALGFGHGLGRVDRVGLDDLDLLAVDAARGIDLVDGQLQAAIALLPQQRQRAAEWEEGPTFMSAAAVPVATAPHSPKARTSFLNLYICAPLSVWDADWPVLRPSFEYMIYVISGRETSPWILVAVPGGRIGDFPQAA